MYRVNVESLSHVCTVAREKIQDSIDAKKAWKKQQNQSVPEKSDGK